MRAKGWPVAGGQDKGSVGDCRSKGLLTRGPRFGPSSSSWHALPMTPAWHPALRSIKVPPSEYPSEHASFIPTSSHLLGVAARCHGSKIGRLPSSRPRAKGGTVRQGRAGGGEPRLIRMCQSSILTCIQCDGGGAQRLARRRARGTAGGTVDCRGRGIEGCRCCSQNILNIGILLNVQGQFLQGLGAAGKKGYWSCCGWWLVVGGMYK